MVNTAEVVSNKINISKASDTTLEDCNPQSLEGTQNSVHLLNAAENTSLCLKIVPGPS